MSEETLAALAAGCAGKTADEIEELILASRHGAVVRDARILAEYLAAALA